MADWLMAGIGVTAGYGIGGRWPRRRVYATNAPHRSRIPPGASPFPGEEACARLGHTQLAWAERTTHPWWLPWRGRQTEIIAATCGDCGRPQARLRIVYPPGHTIQVAEGIAASRRTDVAGEGS